MRFLVACLLSAIVLAAPAQTPQQTLSRPQAITLPLWPNGNPEPTRVTGPEIDPTTDRDALVGGRRAIRITNVSRPTLTYYPAPGAKQQTRPAALVFPGGSYVRLAWDSEGTDVCDWLNSVGMGCILVKYRVPQPGHYPEAVEDLEDAQQAMRMTRSHAAEWHLDPAEIGAIGFSAGAHLAAALSTHPDFEGEHVPATKVDARPNFQILVYPGWLTDGTGKVDPAMMPDAQVPPTLLIMAEDDYTAHVENALGYFEALKNAKVPAEMHLYTQGGHGFGLRPTDLPISRWPQQADGWLHTIHVLGPAGAVGRP